MIKIQDLKLQNKIVLIRVDYNVPIINNNIIDDNRIVLSLPTIQYVLSQDPKKVILISHLGKPIVNEFNRSFSLENISKRLSILLNQNVYFNKNIINVNDNNSLNLNESKITLYENIRMVKGEIENDIILSKYLAKLCDIFVMDGFGVAHRKHASTYGIAQYAKISCAGLLFQKEIDSLSNVLKNVNRPSTLIIGGVKAESKLPVLYNLINKMDTICICGAIANLFLAAKNYSINNSIYDCNYLEDVKKIFQIAKNSKCKIILPIDVYTTNNISLKSVVDINKNDIIYDIGINSQNIICDIIKKSNTVIWNGSAGKFELDNFAEGTKHIAECIAKHKGYSLVGGGETLAIIKKYKLDKYISYISSGGGAFLKALSGERLPAVDILMKCKVGLL